MAIWSMDQMYVVLLQLDHHGHTNWPKPWEFSDATAKKLTSLLPFHLSLSPSLLTHNGKPKTQLLIIIYCVEYCT